MVYHKSVLNLLATMAKRRTEMEIPDWVFEQDPDYQEERDGCWVCGGALHSDNNGDLQPCEGFGTPAHDAMEQKRKGGL